jgi:hypothetical protein
MISKGQTTCKKNTLLVLLYTFFLAWSNEPSFFLEAHIVDILFVVYISF